MCHLDVASVLLNPSSHSEVRGVETEKADSQNLEPISQLILTCFFVPYKMNGTELGIQGPPYYI